MQSLLLDRQLGKVSCKNFERTSTEALYYNLEAQEYPKFSTKKKTVGSINALDFDKINHRFLLSGGADSSIKIFKVGQVKADIIGDLNKSNGGHEYGVTDVKWWPFDMGMFLSSSYDSELKVWDTNTMDEAFSFNLNSKVHCFDISETGDHSLIASGADSSHVRILDLKTTSAVHSLTGHNGGITSVKWSPNNPNELATGSSEGEVRIWDIRRTDSCLVQLDLYRTDESAPISSNDSKKVGVLKSSVKAHARAVNGLSWFPSGKSLITTGNDEKIRVWDLEPIGAVNTLLNFGPFVRNKFPSYKTILLSPISETELQYLWYPSDNGEILVFRIIDGKLVARLRKNLQENSRSCCLTYSGNNSATYFSGTVDGKINIWGPKDERIIEEDEDDFF
ncbi:Vegetative incompatibility protein [Wickerhamomyces ciferrii]|uniref:Vegetative incompatibility protein n=1 Tax=Wickerhamomyces ciferrii (strain ATCC 14091 / BCRC 22168 / CBS 111 / JCM 3599 / NBRC 0793 / NRRL Y-1031 F-60-10) TaxID=1206466 RepID=K0KM49_WICCF|nr:Vegetative incompatibility protein [Wickerhamomyces ciferrii]CCH46315.1 Vegetative incompatibility protein [Wickerhamomyces ciferrii]